jgi:hypothetical protein
MDIFDFSALTDNIAMLFVFAFPFIAVWGIYKRCYREVAKMLIAPLLWYILMKGVIELDVTFLIIVASALFYVVAVVVWSSFMKIIDAKSREKQSEEFLRYYSKFYYGDPQEHSIEQIADCLAYAIEAKDDKLFNHVAERLTAEQQEQILKILKKQS